MRYALPGGLAAYAIWMTIFLVVAFPGTAAAQPVAEETMVEVGYLHGCPGVYAIFALGAATVFATVAGIRTAARPGAWPHWAGLARGCGDAAFLVALAWSLWSMRDALAVIARIGAAVTPADVADGLGYVLTELALGCLAALAGLVGSGLVRLRRARGA